MADVSERLGEIAIELDFMKFNRLTLRLRLGEIAERLLAIAQEIDDLYVPADTTGEIPTNAQGVALARFLRPAFKPDRNTNAVVSFDLPADYIYVRLADGSDCGIDREGRTST